MMEGFFKVYIWLYKYKTVIITLFITLSVVWGLYVYISYYKFSFLQGLTYTLGLFAVDAKTPNEIADAFQSKEILKDVLKNGNWKMIYQVSLFAKFTLLLTIILLYFRKLLSFLYRELVLFRGDHTIVVGLGRNSRFFIDSMLKNKELEHRLIAFETDKDSLSLIKYKNERVSIVVGEVGEMMKNLNLAKCKNIFISTGSDKQNIYYALEFLRLLPNKNRKFNKLVVHIENRTLRNLYADGNILSSRNIDIRIFSYYKESARMLFQKSPLDGQSRALIESGEPFSINVIGNSELVLSIVMEACRLAHYPKQNRLTINCIDNNIDSLEEKINYAFPEIETLEKLNIYIEYTQLDSNSLEFYQHPIWRSENLKHIILCKDDVEENISISTRLREVTYLRTEREAQISIASMNHIQIARKVNHMGQGEDIYSFARADEICSVENLLESHLDSMGQMISHLYGSQHLREQGNLKVAHTVELNSILSSRAKALWNEASIYNRRSSIGQAIHIETKLKVLGLKSRKTEKRKELFRRNREVFNAKLKKSLYDLNLWCKDFLEIEDEYTKRESITTNRFFPKEYDNIFENLLNIEHNRWMAVLILMDNIYDADAKKKNRQKLKIHHLLKPFKEFETPYERAYIINDINALLNIPLYLAKVGYEIIDFE